MSTPSRLRFRPRLEQLDGRDVPAVLTVTSVADSGVGTLRAAIAQANSTAEADTIVFADSATNTPVYLTTRDTAADAGGAGPSALTVTSDITVRGGGVNIIRDLFSADLFRLFRVTAGGALTLDAVLLGSGFARIDGAGGVGMGGAVLNEGTLTITNSFVSGNHASGGYGATASGAGWAGLGGAVYNAGGTVTVTNSTFTSNFAVGASGGPGSAYGDGLGGAIFTRNGTVTITNSTLSRNGATTGGRQVYAVGDGGTATVVLNNTIAGQADTNATDVFVTAVNGGSVVTGGTNNLIRVTNAPDGFGIVSPADPRLDEAGYNGGRTQTMAPLDGSPAIDAGSNAAAAGLTRDGRGFAPRVVNGTVDIGAHEVGPRVFAVGAGAGGGTVNVFNANGSPRFTVQPFGAGWTGGVTVATADVNADGVADVVAGAGPGGDPRVVVYDGQTGGVLATFFAFERNFAGGVFVAAGDRDGAGYGDVVVGAGPGGDPRVQVYRYAPGAVLPNSLGVGVVPTADFFAYARGFAGGVSVAVTGAGQVVTGAGPGGLPHVKLFTLAPGASSASGVGAVEARSFYALRNADGSYYTGGVFVAAGGNLIAVGAMAGGSPRVQAVRAADFGTVADFTAYEPGFRGGVRVGVGRGDSLLTAAGPGGGSRVRGYNRATPVSDETPAALDFDAFRAFDGGAFVAGDVWLVYSGRSAPSVEVSTIAN